MLGQFSSARSARNHDQRNPGIAELATIFDFGLERENFSRYRVPRREKGRGRKSLRTRLFVQFVEQGLGILQVGGVEALGEPFVDFREHRARLVTLALLR